MVLELARSLFVKDVSAEGSLEITNEEAHAKKEEEGSQSLAEMLLEYLLYESAKAETTVDVLLNDVDLTKHDKAREEFSNSSACDYIVHAMKQNARSVSMQWKCLKLIMTLTMSNADNNNKKKDRLLSAGAAEAVICAMKMHAHEEMVQVYGCGALRNLSARDSARVVSGSGVTVIIHAMKSFPKHQELQTSACLCLYNLAISSKGKYVEPIIAAGGGARLAEAHLFFRNKAPKIEEFARSTLKILYCQS